MSQLKAQVNKLLTNVSDGYQPQNLIADKLLPRLSVVQKTGLLGSYGDQHLMIETTVMGGRGKARRVEAVTRSSTTYHVKSHGLEELVTPDDYANVEKPFDAERDAVMGLMSLLKLDKEKALADVMTSTSTITQNETLSGAAQFNDYTNSDPLSKFKTAQTTVYNGCGFRPDTALMSEEVFMTLQYHPGILDALGFAANRAGMLKESEIASAMGVKRLLIGGAQYNSAAEGQTASRASVWGKHIVFCVAPLRAEKWQTSVGYRLEMAGRGPTRTFKSPVHNPPGSNSIIVTDDYQMLISKAEAAYLIEDAIA